MTNTDDTDASAAFDLEEIRRRAAESGSRWVQFFDNDAMYSGLYRLSAGAEDQQKPHQYDELYFVLQGRAKLAAGEHSYEAAPGAVLFVKAGLDHRFYDIADDLECLVFFSKADAKGDKG